MQQHSSARATFEAWTDRLVASVTALEDVVGLVLLGSTAATDRVDAWSDHDFYLVVRPGRQEHFRTSLDWLPDPELIAFGPRETAHGLKVVYRDGHVLEFAVADAEELSTFGGIPWRVPLDRADVTARMEAVLPPGPSAVPDDTAEMELFLAQLVIGLGRAARGEELSGGQLVREYAVTRLTGLLARHLEPAPDVPADPYNPVRRFEARLPVVGAAVATAVAQPVAACGRALLEIAEEHLRPVWPDYPADAVEVTRDVLAGIASATEASADPGA